MSAITNKSPRVYLAGKINRNCWRHPLVPGLREHVWEGGPIATNQFTYVGPFFVGCDHGCFHGAATHGALGEDGITLDDAELVISRCRDAVGICDVFLAFINEHKCYGTVAEIEQALNLNKLVVIALAPGMASPAENEFWFVTDRAPIVLFDVSAKELPRILNMAIQMARRGLTP